MKKENDVADGSPVGTDHDQSIDSDAFPAGGRQPVRQGTDVFVVHVVSLLVPTLSSAKLQLKPLLFILVILTAYYVCSISVHMKKRKKHSKPRRPLSKTEWTVMLLCWRLGRATARQVYEASDGRRDYRTIRTLLDRIAAKGFLRLGKLDRLSVYTPAVRRQRAFSEAVAEFVDNVLERSVTPVYLHLAERDDLSEEEVRFFRHQLEKEENL